MIRGPLHRHFPGRIQKVSQPVSHMFAHRRLRGGGLSDSQRFDQLCVPILRHPVILRRIDPRRAHQFQKPDALQLPNQEEDFRLTRNLEVEFQMQMHSFPRGGVRLPDHQTIHLGRQLPQPRQLGARHLLRAQSRAVALDRLAQFLFFLNAFRRHRANSRAEHGGALDQAIPLEHDEHLRDRNMADPELPGQCPAHQARSGRQFPPQNGRPQAFVNIRRRRVKNMAVRLVVQIHEPSS